jgi:hypothetical protein
VRAHDGYVRTETLAVGFQLRVGATAPEPPGGYCERTEIDGLALMIALRRAERP